MKLYSTFIWALFLLATVANAVTSPITEMALREYQANGRHQATRQKLFKAGRHRPTKTRRMQSGSAMNFADLSRVEELKQEKKKSYDYDCSTFYEGKNSACDKTKSKTFISVCDKLPR